MMLRSLFKITKMVGTGALIAGSVISAFAQQSSIASIREGELSVPPRAIAGSEPPVSGQAVLRLFVAAESKVREALNQHTFKRDVVLQTVGPNGEVTGEYVRNSQFIFDDRGRRIERVTFHPKSTIHEMRITKEDIQDLEGAQLLGIDIVEATKYELAYAGTEIVAGQKLFAVDVRPRETPDPKRMKNRYFVGRVWVDPGTFQIVKIKGVVEPQGKQRFPMFVTWRAPIKETLAFPVRTEADDVLHFKEGDVHYRIKVRYYDYKEFASKVAVKDVDNDDVELETGTPKAAEAPVQNVPSSKSKPEPISTNLQALPSVPSVKKAEVCTTNRTAPPVGSYHWPADSEVKVYFTRNVFTPEQSAALRDAMNTWNNASSENNSGVSFVYAGETDRRATCRGCLTVNKRDVYARDRHHYAFFHPMNEEEGRLLVSAWIDLDVGITEPNALQGFMAHEMAHGLGLWDCPSCKKKRSLMNGFPGLNKNNGLIGPSECDLVTMRTVYHEERKLTSANASNDTQSGAPDSKASIGAANSAPSAGASSIMNVVPAGLDQTRLTPFAPRHP
jgi:hypothetical protein